MHKDRSSSPEALPGFGEQGKKGIYFRGTGEQNRVPVSIRSRFDQTKNLILPLKNVP